MIGFIGRPKIELLTRYKTKWPTLRQRASTESCGTLSLSKPWDIWGLDEVSAKPWLYWNSQFRMMVGVVSRMVVVVYNECYFHWHTHSPLSICQNFPWHNFLGIQISDFMSIGTFRIYGAPTADWLLKILLGHLSPKTKSISGCSSKSLIVNQVNSHLGNRKHQEMGGWGLSIFGRNRLIKELVKSSSIALWVGKLSLGARNQLLAEEI